MKLNVVICAMTLALFSNAFAEKRPETDGTYSNEVQRIKDDFDDLLFPLLDGKHILHVRYESIPKVLNNIHQLEIELNHPGLIEDIGAAPMDIQNEYTDLLGDIRQLENVLANALLRHNRRGVQYYYQRMLNSKNLG